jgi:hypothetical protein
MRATKPFKVMLNRVKYLADVMTWFSYAAIIPRH